MRTGQFRSSGRWRGAALVLLFLSGCLGHRANLDNALLQSSFVDNPNLLLIDQYHVHCPDVLDISMQGFPQGNGPRQIGVDGRIDLGDAGRPRVDGMTVPELTRAVAHIVHVPPAQVQVSVAEFKSQYLYLLGEVRGAERPVPYHGPETIVQLLQRTGGLSAAAAPLDIQVVRTHVVDGGVPEIFHVDLEGILNRNDQRTNVHLMPFDQIYIGQSRRSCLARALPPCLRALCGARRQPSEPPPVAVEPENRIDPGPAPGPQPEMLPYPSKLPSRM